MKKVSKTKIRSTYASSLYQAAEEKKVLGKVMQDVDVLKTLIAENSQIISDLSNQIWPADSKRQALAEIVKKMKLSKEIGACLDVLVDNGRMSELSGILDEFKHIYYRQHNIEEVEVLTVRALSAAQDSKLKALLEKKLAKKVLINYTITPELLGGLIVKYGSSMIDDSLKGKLTRLDIIMKGGQ